MLITNKTLIARIILICMCIIFIMTVPTFAAKTEDDSGNVDASGNPNDMWTVADRIIKDVYNRIAGISTVLAALMTTVCVVGMKLSNNQQKVDQSVDWLKRIWIAWAIINGIGAFLAYIRPLLDGLATIDTPTTTP